VVEPSRTTLVNLVSSRKADRRVLECVFRCVLKLRMLGNQNPSPWLPNCLLAASETIWDSSCNSCSSIARGVFLLFAIKALTESSSSQESFNNCCCDSERFNAINALVLEQPFAINRSTIAVGSFLFIATSDDKSGRASSMACHVGASASSKTAARRESTAGCSTNDIYSFREVIILEPLKVLPWN